MNCNGIIAVTPHCDPIPPIPSECSVKNMHKVKSWERHLPKYCSVVIVSPYPHQRFLNTICTFYECRIGMFKSLEWLQAVSLQPSSTCLLLGYSFTQGKASLHVLGNYVLLPWFRWASVHQKPAIARPYPQQTCFIRPIALFFFHCSLLLFCFLGAASTSREK